MGQKAEIDKVQTVQVVYAGLIRIAAQRRRSNVRTENYGPGAYANNQAVTVQVFGNSVDQVSFPNRIEKCIGVAAGKMYHTVAKHLAQMLITEGIA